MNKYLYIVIIFSSSIIYGQDTIRHFNQNDLSKLVAEYIVDNETQKNNGFFREYDENGELKIHTEYKNGLLWNIFIIKDSDNNQILDFGTFEDGNGTIKNYKNKDTITSIREYKNGVLNGLSLEYYKNGKISMRGNYDKGNRCGTWYRYNKDGTLKENGERDFGKKCSD